MGIVVETGQSLKVRQHRVTLPQPRSQGWAPLWGSAASPGAPVHVLLAAGTSFSPVCNHGAFCILRGKFICAMRPLCSLDLISSVTRAET